MIKVELESDGKGGNVLLSLFDVKRLLDRNVFTEKFFDTFKNKIAENSEYKQLEKLKNVIYDMGVPPIENNSFVLAKSKVGKMDFGLLLERQNVGGQVIQGIWPQDFFESIRDDDEIFEYFIYRLINTPEFFEDVALYVPSQQTIQEKSQERKVEKPAAQVPKPVASVPQEIPQQQRPPQPAPTPSYESLKTPQPATSPPKPQPSTMSAPPVPKIAPKSVLVDDKCPNCKATLSAPRIKILQSGQSTFCPKCLKIIHPPTEQAPTPEQKAKKIEYLCPSCGFPIPYTLLNEIHEGKQPKCVGCGKILDKSVLD